jgi:hypothetical protein
MSVLFFFFPFLVLFFKTLSLVSLALARQLQAEEEYHARREHEAYLREGERRRVASAQQHQPQKPKEKKKGDCIVM